MTYIYEYNPLTGELITQHNFEKKEYPENFTLIEPPEYNKSNQKPVFQNGKWYIYPDNRGKYLIDTCLNVFPITKLGDGITSEGQWLVNFETAEKIKSNRQAFKIFQGKLLEKTQDEFLKEKIEKKEKLFNEEFFYTSLGYVKRVVTFKNYHNCRFLTDILPLLEIGTPIITYNKPDFRWEETPSQNLNVQVNEIFIQECKKQLLNDFYGN